MIREQHHVSPDRDEREGRRDRNATARGPGSSGRTSAWRRLFGIANAPEAQGCGHCFRTIGPETPRPRRCGHCWDVFHARCAPDAPRCPSCRTPALERAILRYPPPLLVVERSRPHRFHPARDENTTELQPAKAIRALLREGTFCISFVAARIMSLGACVATVIVALAGVAVVADGLHGWSAFCDRMLPLASDLTIAWYATDLPTIASALIFCGLAARPSKHLLEGTPRPTRFPGAIGTLVTLAAVQWAIPFLVEELPTAKFTTEWARSLAIPVGVSAFVAFMLSLLVHRLQPDPAASSRVSRAVTMTWLVARRSGVALILLCLNVTAAMNISSATRRGIGVPIPLFGQSTLVTYPLVLAILGALVPVLLGGWQAIVRPAPRALGGLRYLGIWAVLGGVALVAWRGRPNTEEWICAAASVALSIGLGLYHRALR